LPDVAKLVMAGNHKKQVFSNDLFSYSPDVEKFIKT
jgi:hypothetical protein